MTGMSPDEEIARISALLRAQPGIDIIVVDTEEKGRFTTTDRAASIAAMLHADYYTIEDPKGQTLADLVISRKETAEGI